MLGSCGAHNVAICGMMVVIIDFQHSDPNYEKGTVQIHGIIQNMCITASHLLVFRVASMVLGLCLRSVPILSFRIFICIYNCF